MGTFGRPCSALVRTQIVGKRSFSTASDLKISGEASGDERRAALAVRDVKRMVAEGRERVLVVQVGVKHEIVFAAGEVRGTPPEASRTKYVVSWVNSFFFDRI